MTSPTGCRGASGEARGICLAHGGEEGLATNEQKSRGSFVGPIELSRVRIWVANKFEGANR
jgi:hypothetical protein